MSKPKILCTRRFPPNIVDRLSRDYQPILNQDDTQLTAEQIVARAAGCDGIFCCNTERFDAALISALPESVKILATLSVGFEHIDLPAAASRNITVTNTPDVLTEATADAAMLCLLGAARRAAEGDRLVREGGWKRWTTELLLGVHVSGKRLGILGMGRIGRAVAERARGFGMRIHYHNRRPLDESIAGPATYYADPVAMLSQCDFLSINAPSTPETRGFLNAERIAKLPDRAIVVNTARGDIIDDEALIAALKSGKIAAAGLDVFAGEPNIHPEYAGLMNTLLLPHLGSATHETRDAMGFMCLDNFDAFFAGASCPNAIQIA
ncbi:MAG: D-glycerate dehydrogenase [Pseudomonadota bacterium]